MRHPTGYGVGYWASGVFEPECGSETLRKNINSHDFWKRAGISSLLIRKASIDKCIDNVSSKIEYIDIKVTDLQTLSWTRSALPPSSAKAADAFSQIWPNIRQEYKNLWKELRKVNAERILVNAESRLTPDDVTNQIQMENKCILYLDHLNVLSDSVPRKGYSTEVYLAAVGCVVGTLVLLGILYKGRRGRWFHKWFKDRTQS